MTKRIDPDFLALKRCVLALKTESTTMQRATIEYLWDRFVAAGQGERTIAVMLDMIGHGRNIERGALGKTGIL